MYDVIIREPPNPIVVIQNKIELLFPYIKYSHNEFINSIKKN